MRMKNLFLMLMLGMVALTANAQNGNVEVPAKLSVRRTRRLSLREPKLTALPKRRLSRRRRCRKTPIPNFLVVRFSSRLI